METRLGDIIDDFCVKCKRLMNHAVVSILDGSPAKVRCRTCYNDHDYRHEQAPPPKIDPRKAALLLAKAQGQTTAAAAVAAEESVAVEVAIDDAVEAEVLAVGGGEAVIAEEAIVPLKAKAKVRGRK